MPFKIMGPKAVDGAPLRAVIEIHEQSPLRFAFKPKEWNNVKRAALYEGGMDFVVGLLPLRFTRYAYKLGYFISDKSLVQKALNAGVTPSIMTEAGLFRWNKEKGYFELPNADRLFALFYAKVRAGEVKNTREARKRFFEEFKRNIRKRLLRDRAGNVAQANLLPLVDGNSHSDQPMMRDIATSQARVLATATQSKSRLEVYVPFGHPVQPQVAAVMGSVTAEESERTARVVDGAIRDLIRGAKSSFVKRGIAAGQARLRLSPEQRASMSESLPQRSSAAPRQRSTASLSSQQRLARVVERSNHRLGA